MPVPVIVFAAVVLVLAGAAVLALRAGARGQARERAALRAAAAAHGWSLRMAPAGEDGFELTGSSDDAIEWRIRQDRTIRSIGERIDPSVAWSSGEIRSAALRLVVLARSAHERLAAGKGLAIADRAVDAVAGGAGTGVPLRRLLDAGAERDLGDPVVSQRFICVSDDAALAMALIDASVRTALRAWPDEQVSIHVGTPDLRVRLGFARLDDAAIERIVDLGLRLVRAGRAAGLSHRAA